METPTQEWWSAAEIADARLPDLPTTKRKVNQRAKDEGWDRQPGKIRRRKGKGGGLEYHYSLFPIRARLSLIEQPTEEPEPKRSREAAWADFDSLNANAKSKAELRLHGCRDCARPTAPRFCWIASQSAGCAPAQFPQPDMPGRSSTTRPSWSRATFNQSQRRTGK